MRLAHELPEIGKGAIVGMNPPIIANVITVVQERRRIEWQKPQRVDAEIGDIVELGNKAAEIADPVSVAVEK